MRNYQPMSIDKERRILAMMQQATYQNSLKSVVIEQRLNVTERQLREMVERNRKAGLLICVGKVGGYFIARSWEEYRGTFTRNCNLAISALKTQYRALKIFRRDHGQLTIFESQEDDARFDLILAQIAELREPNQPTDRAA